MLSNLYSHRISGPAHWANAKLVRCADDYVVLAHYQGKQLGEWIEATLEGWLGLEINRDKTRVIELSKPGAKLNFLGYQFRYDRDRQGNGHKFLNVTVGRITLPTLTRDKGFARLTAMCAND